MNNKGTRTTITAIVGILLVIACFVFFFMGEIDKEELTIALAGVGTGTAIIGNLFAKDANKSHTDDV